MVDATPLILRGAGIKTYLYHWLEALEETRGASRLSAFPHITETGSLNTEGSVLGGWSTLTRLMLFYLSSSGAGLPLRNLLTRGVDVFHMSSHLRRVPSTPKLTATIYDLTCWLMPEVHMPANVKVTRAFGEEVWRRAERLIAISESAKVDVVQILRIAPEKIEVIYPGVAEQFFNVQDEEVDRVRRKYRLNRPHFLYLGTIEPRKNLARLLNAWAQVPKDLREETELIIAGPFGWESGALHARLLAGGDGVRYLGPLPEGDLPGLTASAQAFVFPSLYEGFGLPVAQAMATGVPVLTSNCSSLIEISRDCALHFDPRSESEIAVSLKEALSDRASLKTMGERGRRKAEEFRWIENSHKSWKVFESL
jgi:glycosyltransferase involved in cell wall biosynthesis